MLGMLGRLTIQLLDRPSGEQREETQEPPHVPIVDVDPELEKPVWRRQLGVEPYRSSLRFTELRAGCGGHERVRQRMRPGALDFADQLHSRGDVPPLIASADLQCAAFTSMELQVVVSLKQHV